MPDDNIIMFMILFMSSPYILTVFSKKYLTLLFSVVGQSVCSVCLAGFYCPSVSINNATSNLLPCPEGYYCPNGTGNDCEV